MKKHRHKILIAVTICLLVFAVQCLTACDSYVEYNLEQFEERIISVELIRYDNEELNIVYDRAEILPADFEKIKVIETLEESKMDEFIDNYFYRTRKQETEEFFAEPVGICVKMNFADGKFILITGKEYKDDKYRYPIMHSMIAVYDKGGYVTDMPICYFNGAYGFEHIIGAVYLSAKS